MISCPECGKQISDRATSCPGCGCPISTAPVAAAPQENGDELNKLLLLARRARESSDNKNAKRYYDQILLREPGNWEATYYSVYFEAMECKIMNISSAANAIANTIFSTFSAISELADEEEKKDALSTIINSSTAIASMFVSSAVGHYNQFSTTNGASAECSGRVLAAGNIYVEIEANLKKVFPEYRELLANFQKGFIDFIKQTERWFGTIYLSRLYEEIEEFYPEESLKNKIALLDKNINSIVTEKKPISSCLGIFFLIVGIIMLICGTIVTWGLIVAIPELILGILFLVVRKPSDEVIAENIKRKQQLEAERNELKEKLEALQK